MRGSKRIDQVLNNAASLKDFSQIFAILDELNRILHKFLPTHLTKHCHIGAIDSKKNLVILYLADPALNHIINGMANPILDNFNAHHFSFAGLITRIRYRHTGNPIRHKHLEPKVKNKLEQLAESINRRDLIVDETDSDNKKEIDF